MDFECLVHQTIKNIQNLIFKIWIVDEEDLTDFKIPHIYNPYIETQEYASAYMLTIIRKELKFVIYKILRIYVFNDNLNQRLYNVLSRHVLTMQNFLVDADKCDIEMRNNIASYIQEIKGMFLELV